MTNLAPKLVRSWLEAEIRPKDKAIVTSNAVKEFQGKLAELCGMHIFCGPMVIAPDSENALSPYYTNKQFKPRDWNAFTWWTQPDAKNVVSILDHSHEVLYYYPEHNLIDITIATCKEYDPLDAVKFMSEFWKPDENGVRYIFTSPDIPTSEWKVWSVE
ncbi:MAG TPA: S-adenosylmethionine decarboxylase [Patescibacteria group bacterium]